MAKTELLLNIKADNDQAMKSIEEVEEGFTRVGRRGRESASGIKEKFDAVNSIVGGLLPRGLQTTIRRFQSTARAVKRAGKSFSALRATLATLGIPALILAIQLLIDNFQTVTDWLGITSAESRLLAEEQEKVTQAMNDAAVQTEVYVNILRDLNATTQAQEGALKALARQVTSLNGLSLEQADLQDRINEAMVDYERLTRAQAEADNLEERIKAKQKEIDAEQLLIDKRGYSAAATRKANRAQKRQEEQQEELNLLMVDYQDKVGTVLEIETKMSDVAADTAQAKKDQAEADRKAAAEALAAQRELEKRLEREADARSRLAKMREQAGLNEVELAKDEMKRREEAELAEVSSASARNAIKQYYATEWENWKADYDERQLQAEQAIQQRIKDAEDKAWQERNMASLNDREKALMQNELYYETLLDYAVENDLDTTQLELDRQAKLEAINQEFNDKELAEKTEAQEKVNEAIEKTNNKQLTAREQEILASQAQYQLLLDLANEYGLDTEELLLQQREAEAAINQKFDTKELEEAESLEKAKVMAKMKAQKEFANLIGTMSSLAEEGSKEAKALAIVEVLTNQAIAMATAVRAAVAAGSTPPTPATPFLVAANIVSMVGGVVSSFASIKKILDQTKGAGGSTGGIGSGGGGGGGGGTTPMVPNLDYDVENNAVQNMNVSAYVVQSQLQGSQLEYNQALQRTTL